MNQKIEPLTIASLAEEIYGTDISAADICKMNISEMNISEMNCRCKTDRNCNSKGCCKSDCNCDSKVCCKPDCDCDSKGCCKSGSNCKTDCDCDCCPKCCSSKCCCNPDCNCSSKCSCRPDYDCNCDCDSDCDCNCNSCSDAACAILKSIARTENALAHILNAEGEKLQKAIELADNICDLLKVNQSVQQTVTKVTFLEQVLYAKLEALECCRFDCPTDNSEPES